MLTSAANFWPLFWTITGAGALFTVIVSGLVALTDARKPALVPVPVEVPAHQQAGHDQHARAA